MSKKTTTPRPTAETNNQYAHHYHPAPDAIRDVSVDEQFTLVPAERARLLQELREALIAGAMGDALNHAKPGQKIQLGNGTVISRS